MKQVCLILLLACCVGKSLQSCYTRTFPGGNECSTADDVKIPVGVNVVEVTSECMKCTCVRRIFSQLKLNCCGYGINAGVARLPPWCKMEVGPDGCTPRYNCSQPSRRLIPNV